MYRSASKQIHMKIETCYVNQMHKSEHYAWFTWMTSFYFHECVCLHYDTFNSSSSSNADAERFGDPKQCVAAA